MPHSGGQEPHARAELAGGGDLGARMRAFDWASTPLGAPEAWPQSLKTAVGIMLSSRQPIWIGWGKELTYLYNDPYKTIIGGKHPWALGKPTSVVWREIWNEIGPMLATAMTGIEGTYVEAQLLIMERNGYPEETYYTFSYTPIPNDDGTTGGIFCANTDDTQRVIGERQLTLLSELGTRTVDARTLREACERSALALGTNAHDLPFAMIYTMEPDGRTLSLAAASGIERGHRAAPPSLSVEGLSVWPVAELRRGQEARVVHDLQAIFGGDLPTGAWHQPPTQAAVLPIATTGEKERPGVLIVGLSPFRLFDENYRSFLGLVAGQIAAAIANADAYEEERKRAEALAEIDRAKTVFFSNASHEFRTPLTLMLSPLEHMLARGPAPSLEVGRDEIALIHRNGLRLLKLVNTLLDFSRIEAGRTQAVYEPTDLAAYTAELASTFRSAMDRAGLLYTVNCPKLPSPVHVDRDMWEKIVLNLLSNAFKYTLEGEVEVALAPSADGTSVELAVRDTGVGVPADEVPRLFDRFYRIEGQPGRTQEGTGIGLALVQELAKLHGGTVRAESTLGRGTTFVVAIPFGTAHLPAHRIGIARRQESAGVTAEAFVEEALRWLPGAAAMPETGIEKELSGPGRLLAETAGRRARVLVADDNADMREYVTRLLAERYDVEPVADGQAALEAARARRPDLILSDVMMPRLGGFGLLRGLRSDQDLRDVPVVLLSARAGDEAMVEGLEAGADDYLVKPFGARELLARIATNLEMARVRREAGEAIREEARRLEILNRTGAAVAAELDLDRLVQRVTDAAVELTGAKFGAFFYNVLNEQGEAYTLYSLSGVPREAFAAFPMPRNTKIFAPTFHGEGVMRSDDILSHPLYGQNPPYNGMPKGHLPVRSYLAVPVVSRSGEVLGGLFFGHPEPGVFTDRAERIVIGIAAQAAIAIDNARLYKTSQQTADDLRRLNETLEQRVAVEIKERMKAELALRQAQKMEAIGQLTGGIAHDFNNLLTVILGSVDHLQRRLPDEALRRRADIARQAADRAAALTHRLLSFARRQPLEPKPVNLNRLVGGMSDLLRRTIGESIAIETVLAGGLWWTFVDANQLESAVLNLAVNARDAMPDGGKLTIETANTFLDEAYSATHEEVPTGQYAMIAVTDTGSGMKKEVIEKAFEPFFTTKEVGHGTGLGLSQVYGFVKQSGGHVKIYSEPDQGTTVRIYLPRLIGGEAQAEDTATVSVVPAGSDAVTILVVEDEPAVRAYSVETLRELGYRVLEAPDGASALRILDANPGVTLLFTDVGLPGGVNGRQLADEARRRHPALKVLFTTGYARNAIVHQGRLDPGVALLGKPFTYNELAAKVRQVVSGD